MGDRVPVLDGGKLLEQLREMGHIGLDAGGKRTRLAAGDEDKMARDILLHWMEEAGLEVRVDALGNIFGILPGTTGTLDDAFMVGSHIDTVVDAGALDGCYGVLAGLSVARSLRESGVVPPRPLVVAAFTNEEGVRFQPDMMGSLAMVGGISLEEALAAKDGAGLTLGSELERIGYKGTEPVGFFLPREYVELHVEQGPVLDAEGLQIGAVEGVQGIWWWRITVRGTANHAGTTPMAMRHDAGYAASRIVTFVRDVTRSVPGTVATVGTMALHPGSINVIPGEAALTIDLRNPSRDRLFEAEEKLLAFVPEIAREEGVTVHLEQLVRFDPVEFDDDLVQRIEKAAATRGFSCRRMASGAGHDAQMMARRCRTAMIFVPSVGGISHSPMEHTAEEDLVRGAELLLHVVLEGLAEDIPA